MKHGSTRRKVLAYIRKNPKAKAKEVANAVGVGIASVYNVTYHARKAQREKIQKTPMTALAPKTHEQRIKDGLKALSPRMQLRVQELVKKIDNVNHPPHYKVGGIEVIDFIESKKFNYNLGNVIKYVSRADHKGNRLEDLKKARWYLDREIGGAK